MNLISAPPYAISDHLRPFYEYAFQADAVSNEYRALCMQVLQIHAKSRPNLDVVLREMHRMDAEIRAYRLAMEFANTVQTDDTPAHRLRPVAMVNNVRMFVPSSFVTSVLEHQRMNVEQLPAQFSCADREQVAQLAGISCAHFCTLKFVRPFVKRIVWMHKPQSGHQDNWAPDMVAGTTLTYRPNQLIGHWAKLYPELVAAQSLPEQRLVNQLQGAAVGL